MKKLFINKHHCEPLAASALTQSNLFFLRSPRLALIRTQVLAVTFFVFVFVACGKPLPTLEGIKLTQWKDDKNGCNHYREKLIDTLISQKDKFKGLSEDDVIALLGRPDQNELYKRNEKFYKYFLQPGPSCRSDSSETILSIRFNSVGLAKEATIVAND
jgi:hypothetical protein